MKPKIDLIGIVTNQFKEMLHFYRDILGFKVKLDMESYVEFESEGVRFAITTNTVMSEATKHQSYNQPATGQKFELAFPVPTPDDVDRTYQDLVEKGATPIKAAADMPWKQRAAFIADPDGNIHEIFADLK